MDARFIAGYKGEAAVSLPPCRGTSSSHVCFLPSKECAVLPICASKGRASTPKLTTDDGCTVPTTVDRRDSWLDLAAINYLTRAVQAAAGAYAQEHFKGKEKKKEGYEGLLEVTRHITRTFEPARQREVIGHALHRAVPSPFITMIKALLPVNTKFSREVSAAFASIFFVWLLGPSEVGESEFHGRREKNILHVKKCRYLEGSNCAGMCTNLCKFPTQKFLKDSTGVPVTFVPNFEDRSCKMIFGQEPPSPHQDPASSQPCYKLCKISKRHHEKKCST